MDKAAFKDLLERYLANNCSEKERLLVEKLYDLLGEDKRSVIDDLDSMEDAIWNRIKEKTDFNQEDKGGSTGKLSPRRIGRPKTYLRIAASILLLVTAGLIWFQFQSGDDTEIAEKKTPASQNIIANNEQKPMHIWLEDSTKVTLSPKSRLDIPTAFSEQDKREVFLKGEAIFDVTKDASKPFLVYTGEVVTRVIGTSFKITSDSNNQNDVEVAVLSGKVSVYNKNVEKKQKKVNNGVVLTPNQKVTYHAENKQFRK